MFRTFSKISKPKKEIEKSKLEETDILNEKDPYSANDGFKMNKRIEPKHQDDDTAFVTPSGSGHLN